MKRIKLILAISGCALSCLSAPAQITNIPLTKIEMLEAHTQTIIVKGSAPIGVVNAGPGVISVRIKASSEVNTGRKLEGIVIEIAEKEQSERTIIDYDEVDTLLNGIEFMSKADYDVSPLPGFEAVYTSRAGFRVAAYTSKRSDTIQTYVRSSNSSRIYFTANQLAEFRTLIQQAKTNLDSLREQR